MSTVHLLGAYLLGCGAVICFALLLISRRPR